MKWIKTYEEIAPDKYRRAGTYLMNIPHKKERGKVLKDYGSVKEWGVFNMTYVKNTNDLSKAKRFTKPSAKFLLNVKKGSDGGNGNVIYEDISVEDMIDLWESGSRELYFNIQFYFEPLEETKDALFNSWPKVPFFSFKVNLSTWDAGLESWNDPDDWEGGDSPKQYTIDELYSETKNLHIKLDYPRVSSKHTYSSNYSSTQYVNLFGLFNDRNSAFKFKKLLPSLIDADIEREIWKVFSLLGDSEGFKMCIDKLKNSIRVNYLFDEKPELGRVKSGSNWFLYNDIS